MNNLGHIEDLNTMNKDDIEAMEKRVNNFVFHYKNNTLQNMEDYQLSYRIEGRKIVKALSSGKGKIKLQKINEIILKTGQVLPLFSISFNEYYLYDGNICYQNCINIYKKFCQFSIDKNNMKIRNQLLLLYITMYIKHKDYDQKVIDFYTPINLDYKQLQQFYYISFKLYKSLNILYQSINVITYALADLYQQYLQSIFTDKQKKFFLNIIIKMSISKLEKNDIYDYITKKLVLLILNILISNWNLLSNKYKSFFKKKFKDWISFIKKNNDQNNEDLQQINNICLHLIQKL